MAGKNTWKVREAAVCRASSAPSPANSIHAFEKKVVRHASRGTLW